MLGQRGVGALGHHRGQLLRPRTTKGGSPAAAPQRGAAALARLPQPAVHRADRNSEPLGQHALAALAPLMGRQHALPQVYGQRHGFRTPKARPNADPNRPFNSPGNPL